jgi:hypothetical protein
MIPGWKDELEGEYIRFLRDRGTITPADFASRFDLSECCAIYWLTELAKEGRIRIPSVEFVEEGETPCGPLSALSCRRKAYCPVGEVADKVKQG